MKKVQQVRARRRNAAAPPLKWFSSRGAQVVAAAGGAVVVIGIAFSRSARAHALGLRTRGLSLLQQESVQRDLGMSFDQVANITLISQKRQDARDALKDATKEERDRKAIVESFEIDKEIRGLLDPEQLVRLKQVALQLRGTRAWGEDEVVKRLKLTHDQRVQLATIRDEYDTKRRDLQKVENKQEQQKKSDELKTTEERLLAVLDATQLAKWQDMVGAPFAGEIKRPDRGPGAPAAGGGGGGRRGGGQAKGAAPKAK